MVIGNTTTALYKPSYSDIVSGRTLWCGKLEGSTGKSFVSSKKQPTNVKRNSTVESNKAETGQDMVSPPKSTRNSREKIREDLEQRTSSGLTDRVSPPKPPMCATITKRSIFKEKARNSVEHKNNKEDQSKKETEDGYDLKGNANGVTDKAQPANTVDSKGESIKVQTNKEVEDLHIMSPGTSTANS